MSLHRHEDDRFADSVIDTPRAKPKASALETARADIWEQFQSSTIPMLKDMEEDLKTRSSRFVEEARISADEALAMQQQQGDISRESLGISLTAEQQEASSRLARLGGAASQVSAQNQAVDIAEDINRTQATALTSIQTGIRQDALANLTGADNLKTARDTRYVNDKAAANNSNAQLGSSVAMLAMMI